MNITLEYLPQGRVKVVLRMVVSPSPCSPSRLPSYFLVVLSSSSTKFCHNVKNNTYGCISLDNKHGVVLICIHVNVLLYSQRCHSRFGELYCSEFSPNKE